MKAWTFSYSGASISQTIDASTRRGASPKSSLRRAASSSPCLASFADMKWKNAAASAVWWLSICAASSS